ncbi:MAG TPA: hypothetical protein PKO38_04955 [Bacillota bacterium]|nr:hypothetical protein [Bacillota bacterium]HOP68349.1 hypothetical protein [Bacillota bacterium]HPT33482.1 hypothetical protein [Bacillota bacterium]HPZ63977.1 hypothetical protein [Bacillota bacterium]HQD05786.1 hypothetical protein [Bacillota bacterium]
MAFVYDGPIFSHTHPLPVETGAVVDFGTPAAIDLRLSCPRQ